MDLTSGEFLKMRREELGLTQKTLADDFLSVATISNLETGAKFVSREKFNYYCRKLGLDPDKIESEMEDYKQSKDDSLQLIELQLRSIDNDIAFVTPQQALRRLRDLEPQIKKCLPGHLAQVEYLRGRCYIRREHTLDKAKKHFRKAIYIFDKYSSIQHTYFKAASLYHLSRIHYFENKLLEALKLVNQGLDALDQCTKENSQKIIYHLLICKVIYLDELERHGEANEVLKIMWNGLERIRTEVFLNMCQIQAEIYKKHSQYDKAMSIAQLGIELAKKETRFDRCHELWTTLGSIYKAKKDFNLAELCLNTALNFKSKVRKKSLIVQTYTELGSLYLQINDIHKAQKVLQDCLKIKTKDAVRLFEVYQTLGDCFLQKGEIREALTNWEKAAELANSAALHQQEHRITLKLVQHYENINVIKHKEYLKKLYALNDIAEGAEIMKPQVEINLHLTDIGDPPDF